MKFKRVCSFLFITILCLSGMCSSVFALKYEKASYQSAKEMANVFIHSIAEQDETTTWTDQTKISQFIPVFDLEGQENGYILNLSTNQTPSGYLFIDTVSPSPQITEYGYDGQYYITDNALFSHLKNKKLYYLGLRCYAYQTNDKFFEATQSVDITDRVSELKKRAVTQTRQLSSEQSTQAIALSTVIYESVSVPNLWANAQFVNDFVPVIMDDFPGVSNHCYPTCGINLLRYWRDRRFVGNLFVNNDIVNSFNLLRVGMNHVSSGISDTSAFLGVGRYLTANGLTGAAGNDYRDRSSFDWGWIKTQISNGNPLCMGLNTAAINAPYKAHAVLGVGYQNTSVGQYVRIVDGWDRSLSHFVKYEYTNVDAIWYYRW